MTAYTGKCDSCGHSESAHNFDTLKNVHGTESTKACRFYQKDGCLEFVPQIDIEAYNSIDGTPGITLYKFQEEYLKNTPAKYIFAADTGTGKEYMSIAHYDRHAYLTPLLILGPASKVHTGDYERSLKRYFAGRLMPEYEIYSYEKFSRVPTIEQYKKTGNNGLWRDYMARHKSGYFVIFDEFHKCKNPQSGVGKRAYELSKNAVGFVGLSATPLPNGWIDAANYFKIFGFVSNITDFKRRYVDEVNHKGFPEIRGYWHEGELTKRWNSIAKPLSKDKALDLPSQTFVPIVLPAGKDYLKVEKERLFGDKFLDNPSALLHALRQSIIEPKIAWLDTFLEGVSDNVVVFYNYQSERDAMLKLLRTKKFKDRKVFRQDGEKHEVPNKEAWNDLNRTITLAQYQSGSTGIELTYAATTVYFSPTYSYSNYEQSIGRTNRNGQIKKMTLYLLCAPSTIEKDIWASLRQKSDFSVNQWYRKRFEEGK